MCKQGVKDIRHVMLECCVLGGARTKLIEIVGRIDLVDIGVRIRIEQQQYYLEIKCKSG